MDDNTTKIKLTLEYNIDATTASLFWAISTTDGLRAWFADDVTIIGQHFTFYWSKLPTCATLLSVRDSHYIKLKWDDDKDKNYFLEFKINKSELTGTNTLIITDFVTDGEQGDATDLWNNQVEKLKRAIGCLKN